MTTISPGALATPATVDPAPTLRARRGIASTIVATAAPESGDVVIVNISDDDYRQTFKGRSPLNPRPLQELIDSVLKQSPAVVGIDISTADADDAPLLRHYERTTTPIVWVRDAFALDASAARTQTWQLDSVLGAQNPPAGIRTGLSLFPRDADRFVRGYYRHVPLKTTDGDIAPASFAWAIVQTFCSSPAGARNTMCTALLGRERQEAGDAGEHELLRFNFAGDRYTFRKVPATTVAAAPPGLFANAIVLVGGTFAAARDFYATPFGPMAGVELTALAVESELKGGGITAANEILMIVMDLVAGVVLVWLLWRWTPGSKSHALLASAAILACAFAGSYVAFRGFGYWASFVPVGAGVWLHQLYDRAHDAREIRKELEECRKRLGSL